MADSYAELAAIVEKAGIRCHFQSADQMVVSGQVGAPWPHRGNSFWVTHATGSWHLFTWIPVGYRVPESNVIAQLCKKCMDFGEGAMYRVPPELVAEFALTELTDDEMDWVFDQMERSDHDA